MSFNNLFPLDKIMFKLTNTYNVYKIWIKPAIYINILLKYYFEKYLLG